jgi:hypothetical protein
VRVFQAMMSSLALTRMITEITLPNAAAARESQAAGPGNDGVQHDGVQGGGPGPPCCTGKGPATVTVTPRTSEALAT